MATGIINAVRVKIYAGVFIALVGAGFSAYWLYDEVCEIKKFREIIASDLKKLGQDSLLARSRVDTLTEHNSSLQSIVQFLEIVSLSDHRPAVKPLQEWSQRLDSIPAQIAGYEARLKELEAVRSVSNKEEARAALSQIARLQSEVKRFQEDLAKLDASSQGYVHTMDAILKEEREHIHSGLRLFAASLDGVLNEIAVTEEGRTPAEADLETTSAIALNTARLAELLYMPESLVAKQRRIISPSPSIQAINAHLKIGQGHKLLLRKIILAPARDQIPSSIAFPSRAKSPWRVRSLGLNVRLGPSVNSAVLCTLFEGDLLRPIQTEGYWWFVSTRCGNGWVASKYLRRLP